MDLIFGLEDELQAAVAEDAWPALLVKLADLLGAEEVTFGGGASWSEARIYAPRTDPGYVGVYMDTYHQQNRFMRGMARQSVGRVLNTDMLPEMEQFRRTDFYNLWCVPQQFRHAFGFSMNFASGWAGTLMANTGAPVSQEQMEKLSLLMPHLQRAVESHLMMQQLRLSNSATLSVLALAGQGALFLDRAGRVVEANGIAEDLLRSGRLPTMDGRLHSLSDDSERALTRLVSLCLSAPDTAGGRIEIEGMGGRLGLQCAPFSGSIAFPLPQRPAVIVMVTDPGQKTNQIRQRLQREHGLTAAEVELALAVVETGSRKAAADLRGVTDATARAQLTSIFDKTGVRRQTDLIRLLVGGDSA